MVTQIPAGMGRRKNSGVSQLEPLDSDQEGPIEMTFRAALHETVGAAKRYFTFLSEHGFRLIAETVDSGDNVRYDGWRLVYGSRRVSVIVDYHEMEFNVVFVRRRLVSKDRTVSFWALDPVISKGERVFYGQMFTPEKLPAAIARMSDAIRRDYTAILRADATSWKQAEAVTATHELQQKNESERITNQAKFGWRRSEAGEAFRSRDYTRVVELLGPMESHLSKVEAKKLAYSKKKLNAV